MSSFHFPDGLVEVDYARFLSQHDVVYHAPAAIGSEGLPVGNGDLGAMIWTPTDRLQLQLNKCDLWDDRPDGPFGAWSDEEEEFSTMLRSAGILTIGNGTPVYDRLFLTDFDGRLRLAEAEVVLHAQTPFAEVFAEIFATAAEGVLVIRYRDATEDNMPRRIELSRWGSRSLLHWYRKLRRTVAQPLAGTESGTDGRRAWITQELRRLQFAVAIQCDGPVQSRRLQRRSVVLESGPTKTFEGTIYLAVVNSEEAENPLAEALERVDRAMRLGPTELTATHRQSWQKFWEASFVDLPAKQDYLENLWYLNNYHVASCSRGRYPPNHINAVWSWERDVRPWAHYYHWNNQIYTWSLHAIGHGELVMPYYRWRRAMLNHAIEDARRVHGREGAFYSDVSNRLGFQATEHGLSHNLTPGPQIAADFWRHYAYTRDRAFLDEYAYPVLREVTRFYLDTLRKGSNGRYTFLESQPYESNILTRDTLTDLAHARQVFRYFLDASTILDRDHTLRERCQETLDNLADYVVSEVSTEYQIDPASLMDLRPVLFKEVAPGDLTMPIWFIGAKVATPQSRSSAEIPDGTLIHEGMGDPAKGRWLFTSSSLAPVFPANQVGLDQAGTPEFQIAVNTVRALGNNTHSFSLGMIARARLGLADELATIFVDWVETFQIFVQGFTHYFRPNHPDMRNAMTVKEIAVVDSPGEKIHWPMEISHHWSLEGGPLLQLTINEMLLQSYSGTIRVFPAVPADWEGTFRLHAVGRFIVSAARQAGRARYVVVESQGGEPCRLASPWADHAAVLYCHAEVGWRRLADLAGEVLSFETESGQIYLVLPNDETPGNLGHTAVTGEPNQRAKTLGQARLGLQRGF